uniref:Uncharacterized protein n=1 Tax=Nicotiana tabacum TaxID=4097 RepID=A0A1S3ZM04_TOBAC|nr:PREDICTED: uncharacterized protein LOC107788248 [Nicotiana tabacum]
MPVQKESMSDLYLSPKGDNQHLKSTWTLLFKTKDEIFQVIVAFVKKIQRTLIDSSTEPGPVSTTTEAEEQVVEKGYDIEASQVISTPIATTTHPDMDEPGSPLNQTMYRDIIESLLYLTASRPDIELRVEFCARFKSNLKDSHLKASVIILRYLRGTQDLVLYYLSSNG